MEFDTAKLIGNDSSSDAEDIDIEKKKMNRGTKSGTLKKPMFSLFDVIIFFSMGKQNEIFRARLPVSNV